MHATSDGVVVVHHDFSVSRANNSDFASRAIAALTMAELETVELAPGVGIPTLDEALRAICGIAKAYIEIKAPNIASRVAQVIANVPGAASLSAVHSFDHRIVRDFCSHAPDVPTGILIVGYPIRPDEVLRSALARDFWESCEFYDRALVDSIHSVGGRCIAWTCNDVAVWDQLIELGVDGICTDRIGDLVSHGS